MGTGGGGTVAAGKETFPSARSGGGLEAAGMGPFPSALSGGEVQIIVWIYCNKTVAYYEVEDIVMVRAVRGNESAPRRLSPNL